MTEQDLADLWAYLQSVPPLHNRVRPHELPFPFNLRFLLLGWKLINFDQGERIFDPDRSEAWNRGVIWSTTSATAVRATPRRC